MSLQQEMEATSTCTLEFQPCIDPSQKTVPTERTCKAMQSARTNILPHESNTFPKDHIISIHARLPHQEDQIISDLTVLRAQSWTGSPKEFIIRSPLTDRVINAILVTFHHFGKIVGEDHRWGSLVLETSDDAILTILKDISVVSLFRGLVIEVRDAPLSDTLLQDLWQLYRKQRLESLSFRRCKLTPQVTILLQNLLETKAVKRLQLHRVKFTDPKLSIKHLQQGFKKADSSLKHLELNSIDNQEILSQILDSLHGNQSLQKLVLVPCWSNESLSCLMETLSQLVAHPDCCIEKLQLTCWTGVLGKSFWKGFGANQSLREIFLIGPVKDGDFLQLVEMASRSSSLVKIHADVRIKDLTPYMLQCDGVNSLRSIQLDLIQVEQNSEHILDMVSERFPFLYQLSNVGPDMVRQRSLLFQKGSIQDLEKASSLTQIGLWLERNQVGRAMLLPSIVDTVPLGLWPTVLSKAARSNSILYEDLHFHQPNRPPLDGLHFMMQGLLPYLFSNR